MILTARADFAIDVFEGDELSAVNARRLFAEIRVERQMLNLLLLEKGGVVRFESRAVEAATIVLMTA